MVIERPELLASGEDFIPSLPLSLSSQFQLNSKESQRYKSQK